MRQTVPRRRPARLSCPRPVCAGPAAPGGAAPRAWGGGTGALVRPGEPPAGVAGPALAEPSALRRAVSCAESLGPQWPFVG
eukprot:3201907-Alexandrium_andersonii.AAC.1